MPVTVAVDPAGTRLQRRPSGARKIGKIPAGSPAEAAGPAPPVADRSTGRAARHRLRRGPLDEPRGSGRRAPRRGPSRPPRARRDQRCQNHHCRRREGPSRSAAHRLSAERRECARLPLAEPAVALAHDKVGGDAVALRQRESRSMDSTISAVAIASAKLIGARLLPTPARAGSVRRCAGRSRPSSAARPARSRSGSRRGRHRQAAERDDAWTCGKAASGRSMPIRQGSPCALRPRVGLRPRPRSGSPRTPVPRSARGLVDAEALGDAGEIGAGIGRAFVTDPGAHP